MNTPEIKIVSRPEILAVGMSVNTSMANAPVDCPKLWHEIFGPRIAELIPAEMSGEMPECYGISWLIDKAAGTFEYWAALPHAPGVAVPEGMKKVSLPAGLYAECPLDSMEDLPAYYNYFFTVWLPGQNKYIKNATLPCYELYPADFMQTGRCVIYFAVLEK